MAVASRTAQPTVVVPRAAQVANPQSTQMVQQADKADPQVLQTVQTGVPERLSLATQHLAAQAEVEVAPEMVVETEEMVTPGPTAPTVPTAYQDRPDPRVPSGEDLEEETAETANTVQEVAAVVAAAVTAASSAITALQAVVLAEVEVHKEVQAAQEVPTVARPLASISTTPQASPLKTQRFQLETAAMEGAEETVA